MAAWSKTGATVEDLQKLPEHVVGEIIDGVLIVSARPGSPHLNAASRIGAQLERFHGPVGGSGVDPGGWVILHETELRLGRNVLVPDLAGWRRERMPKTSATASIELAPDWVCEIASPSTERLDRTKKMAVYARAGVMHLWIVNPIERHLENYVNGDGRWVLAQAVDGVESPRARVVPFDALELDLARWWPEEEPAT